MGGIGHQCFQAFDRVIGLLDEQLHKIVLARLEEISQPAHNHLLKMTASPAAKIAATGIVVIQVMTIWPAVPQRTLDTRSAEPTPMMAELTTCVVLTGPPSRAAVRITPAEAICVVNPCTGRILKNLPPSVLMSRQPPVAVPSAMAPAHNATTHLGTLNSGSTPAETRPSVMM